MVRYHNFNDMMHARGQNNPRAKAKTKRFETRTLTLHQVTILRRLREGQSQASISRSLNYSRGVVHKHLQNAMELYPECTTYEELWSIPAVTAQLDGE